MSIIKTNLIRVLEKIAEVSENRPDVKLIAVSKRKPWELAQEAFQAGQIRFGENQVQEARDKSKLLPSEIEWHLIGPLQKNKAKYCPSLFSAIHTLHRFDVAQLLEKKCQELNSQLEVLIQMNLSGEETKSGLKNIDELRILEDQILENCPRLKLTGLMTIGSLNLSDYENQKIFAKLRKIKENESTRLGLKNQMKELSTGMSSDFEIAIKEGATYVRIGSAIFGERDKK